VQVQSHCGHQQLAQSEEQLGLCGAPPIDEVTGESMRCTGVHPSVRHTNSTLVLSTSVTMSIPEVQAQLVVRISQDDLLYKDIIGPALLDLLAYFEDVISLNPVACAFLNSLIRKSTRNSAEFWDYSNSGPFQVWTFHRNFTYLIVKCVPANSEHFLAGLESFPAINSSNFMNWKRFLPFFE